jgi:polyvinyl alcohol dehydrogenase (cytochrome)
VPIEIAMHGAEIYHTVCAVCHEHAEGRTPNRAGLTATKSADFVLRAMTVGAMQPQTASLNLDDKKAVAAYLIGRMPTGAADVDIAANRCQKPPRALSMNGSNWNGWGGYGTANLRYQPYPGLSAADVPKLKLKWAFAYPGGTSTPPAIVGGRLFVPSMAGVVYSLDAKTGCTYWATDLGSASRSAITVGRLTSGKYAAFVSDWRGRVHALDADTGMTLWQVQVEEHQMVRLTGAPTLYQDRLYVPVSSSEESAAMLPNYICCTFRGSVVALDAASGRQLWRTYTIDQVPAPLPDGRHKGPSGASVWSAPTIDAKRGLLYIGTGNSYTAPAAPGSDAVIALDLKSGAKRWVSQVQPADAFVAGCGPSPQGNCPVGDVGQDFDLGSSPLLLKMPDGKERLVVTSKSGEVIGLDIDLQGKLLWRSKVGFGGLLGGIEWGGASDRGERVFVTVSDAVYGNGDRPGQAENAQPGLYAVSTIDGRRLWSLPAPQATCGWEGACTHTFFAAPLVIPGVVFAGSFDGHLYATDADDGRVLWDVSTGGSYYAVNGGKASGGSIDHGGQTIAGSMLFVNSGGRNGHPGNALLAFSVDGK